eukprot:CAMPEP_0206232096 /NCGR_PEP_ID=MMETSP0047_2-20121206/11223_1 /ASSEMBLY_ACC=CAM_ASM_000192 /TAXON_ID=195065 /ORGANISM="Chroomonas mesostigmatica_cf, Strain CCMP1168" /LENGTH=420 /DNA_ID=CAMNT_0053655789 /DNA_START=85 /DNA_END=1347 /DNA_ORIENTATION=-
MRHTAALSIVITASMLKLAVGFTAWTSLMGGRAGSAFVLHGLGGDGSRVMQRGSSGRQALFGTMRRSLCMQASAQEPPKRKIKLGSRSKNPKAARAAEKAKATASTPAAKPKEPAAAGAAAAAPAPAGEEVKQGVDKKEGDADEDSVSNREKFRQTQINQVVLAKIRELRVCSSMSQAMRAAQRDLAQREEIENEKRFRGFSRPPMYRDMAPHIVNFVGQSKKDKLSFIAGALKEASFPPEGLPEVCFCGRSNVGKSSIINAVTLSTVARSSEKPGMTQQFNFYQLPRRLMLVDLPGYGFAFADPHKMESWKILMDRYSTSRKVLKRAFVIIDARHGLKVNDKEFLNRLEQTKTSFQIVLTKCDLVREEDLARRHTILMEELNNYSKALKTVRFVSAYTGAGLSDLAQDLYSLSVKKSDS